MKTVTCEYCQQPIARVDVEDMTSPPSAIDFCSVDPVHKIPPPFHESLQWRHFKCPYCKLRPFIDEEHISVIGEDGRPERVELSGQVFTCVCGKTYKHQTSLYRHKRECDQCQ